MPFILPLAFFNKISHTVLQILKYFKSIPSIGLVLQGLSMILIMKTHLMDMTKYIQIFNLLTLRAPNNFKYLMSTF